MFSIPPVPLDVTQTERILDILLSWHRTEFFIPFDLTQIMDEKSSEKRQLRFTRQHLVDNADLFDFPMVERGYFPAYELYIGLFDKSEIAECCQQILGKHSGTETAQEEQERTAMEGLSCFAKFKLSADREINFEEFSLSTVPWAMGTLRRQGLTGLTLSNYEKAEQALKNRIANYEASRAGGSNGDILPLQPDDILEIHELLCNWAGYTPQFQGPVVLLQRTVNKLSRNMDQFNKTDKAITEDQDDEERELIEPEIDILNSFFIKDLERIMNAAAEGELPHGLYQYLTPGNKTERLDLYGKDGNQTIWDALLPDRLNMGHWFDNPKHHMSLMQQFAINKAFSQTERHGIFSVNGPPGTGKTTLLRDIIAENIVQRAKMLATFDHAGDTLVGDPIKIDFSPSPFHVRQLAPELTGFEMVVASSNNAAINNISLELPLRSSLGDCWKEQSYLRTVANNFTATGNAPPQGDASPWGLVSCALGNQSNRRKFGSRFCHDAQKSTSKAFSCQTVLQWIDSYQGPSFEEASSHFTNCLKAVEQEIEHRSRFAHCIEQQLKHTEKSYVHAEMQAVSDAEKATRDISEKLLHAQHILAELFQERADIASELQMLESEAPGWVHRVFKSNKALAYRARHKQLQYQLKAVEAKILVSEQKVGSLSEHKIAAESASKAAEETLRRKQDEWAELCNEAQRGKELYPEIDLPTRLDDLSGEHLQIRGLWSDEDLSCLRSALFQAALSLHEAWLADVGKAKNNGGHGFRANIYAAVKMLQYDKDISSADATLLWQSLFLVVPVISSTFASVARQFGKLGSETLGWLFIDEAGQAVPQAAVGAIWRTQRTVIVGDPLQIEPVFTVPGKLINSIADLSPHTEEGHYSPNRVSVQTLADRCNTYGSSVSLEEESTLWTGSPLRVHRRCLDPMFSLSNQIAYQGRMIFGLKTTSRPAPAPLFIQSCWVDIGGLTSRRQVVPQQIDFVTKLVATCWQHQNKLPALYIITPFKAVGIALRKSVEKRLENMPGSERKAIGKSAVRKWCTERIGTVHTFQGKEEGTVLMVLGADRDHAGAACWASSRPNLLNVALTRAKKNVIIIGDKALWGKMSYFETASRCLPSVHGEEIMSAIHNTTTDQI